MAKRPSNPRSAQAFDKALGEHIKQARIAAGMSQMELGAKLGITFQQVQKYEWGKNRVSAARLAQISTALGRSVTWFYAETARAA